MNVHSIERRRTRPVRVGPITIGGGAPVSVQSMTKTHTEDVGATVEQIRQLAAVGCQIVRCAVPGRPAARALDAIKKESPLPLIADIHFDHRLALMAVEQGVDGVRVNPGNMKDIEGLRQVFRAAAARDIKVRIGVNSGSVRPRVGMNVAQEPGDEDVATLMVREALSCGELAEAEGFRNVVISLKASDVATTIAAYRLAADRCDYPFHLGVTAAGPAESSVVKSSIGIGTLLAEGIGDTVRVSMTGPPHEEVSVAIRILEALGLREPQGPQIISCPTCGRCGIDLQGLVKQVSERLAGNSRGISVAIMGCVVNGPGEAAEADVGIAGGKDFGYLFRKGKKIRKVASCKLLEALVAEVEALP